MLAFAIALLFNFGLGAAASTGDKYPQLLVDGFSWAENLVFDGLGNLFVAEAVRGELLKINLCEDGAAYCKNIYLEGFKSVGGLRTSKDGKKVYAAVTFKDDKTGIVSAPTIGALNSYEVVAYTRAQPNGLMFDEEKNVFYYTKEGHGNAEGIVVSVNIETGKETVFSTEVSTADGAWLDIPNQRLFVGDLFSKKISVFNTSDADNIVPLGVFDALSSLSATNMLDDFTLYNPEGSSDSLLSETMMIGADFTASTVKLFSLDGKFISDLPLPDGVEFLNQPTSVRWGKGPGFDNRSIYVTEGGGLTRAEKGRRVVQFKL